ncbi:MAG: potassium channel family protein [Christensenellales bacterium]
MYLIIVGGGKVGYYLSKTLVPEKHRLTLIEEDYELCKKIANELNDLGIVLIHGDGTDVNYLKDAEIETADVLIAVTGHDENNLVACQLAKNYFGVPRTIARVNNPKNIKVFENLGVDSVVSSTAHIAEVIEQEVDWVGVNRILSQKVGDVRIKEFSVTEGSVAAGKKIMELDLPRGTILISIIRENNAFIPNGQTQILTKDLVIALTNEDTMKKLADYFSDR